MNISGWWVDTHASRAGIETRMRMACAVAEMRYGEELSIDLGQRASDHEPDSLPGHSTPRGDV